MHFSTLASILAFGTTGWAAYTLEDDYFSDGDFFSQFSFWTPADGPDPTNGFVNYDRHENLLESSANNAKMWVSNATSAPNGRESIRITSNKSYQSGLIILDVESMPGGVCGTWPAFWTVGPDWPNNGEIDIIEGVNDDSTNQMTLHTGPGCSITNSNSEYGNSNAVTMTGTVEGTTCAVSDGDNTGCGIVANDKQSYGAGLNQGGGGVYATEWTDKGIAVYFFPRSSIPSDIDNGKPDPSSWGSPVAHFAGGCDFGSSFKNNQIVFDTTFCGDWAGADDVWSQSCAASTGKTCQDYVAQNGEDFEGQFWSVNSLKVYQNDGSASEPESSAAPVPTQSSNVSIPASTWAPAPTASASQSNYAPAPTASASQPGWAPIVSGSNIVPAPTSAAAPAPSSPAEEQPWGAPSNTWGGGSPWQSGSPWGQQRENADGGWAVGTPARERRHAKHLLQHKRHVAGGFS